MTGYSKNMTKTSAKEMRVIQDVEYEILQEMK